MMFSQIKQRQYRLITQALTGGGDDAPPAPLVLAYVGDAVLTLYIRRRLAAAEKNKTRILHGVAAQLVSAVEQARMLETLLPELEPAEHDIIRRGRNTKSAVPKSASVRQYRLSTGFECLLGWLYWQDARERLDFVLRRALSIMLENLQKSEAYEYED